MTRSILTWTIEGLQRELRSLRRDVTDLQRDKGGIGGEDIEPAGQITGAQVKLVGAAQSIPNSAWTSISFDTEDYDTGSYYDTANPDRFLIPVEGLYLVTFSSNFAKNGTGVRGWRIYVNNFSSVVTDQRNAVDAGFWSLAGITQITRFEAGDYIQAQQYQSSGGALNAEVGTGAGTADQQPRFSIARIE